MCVQIVMWQIKRDKGWKITRTFIKAISITFKTSEHWTNCGNNVLKQILQNNDRFVAVDITRFKLKYVFLAVIQKYNMASHIKVNINIVILCGKNSTHFWLQVKWTSHWLFIGFEKVLIALQEINSSVSVKRTKNSSIKNPHNICYT